MGHLTASAWHVTQGPADLIGPPDDSPESPLRYGLVLPMQVAPGKVALLCNVRQLGVPCVDFENGGDVIVIDSLDDIASRPAVRLLRNHRLPHPQTGQPLIAVTHLKVGGFVPLGALRPDGTPHPHAGTGFAVGRVYGFAADYSTRLWSQLRPNYKRLFVFQLAFDGSELTVTDSRFMDGAELLADVDASRTSGGRVKVVGCGLGSAVCDGDDLLYGQTVEVEGECTASGVARWSRGAGGWRPVAFAAVTPPVGYGEPSIVRDNDGRLLLAARNGLHSDRNLTQYDICVWRSADAGIAGPWEQVIHAAGARAHVPVILNQAGDGSPYIVSSPLDADARDGAGRPISIWSRRQRLMIWPLTDDRRSLEPPRMLRDTAAFGPPPAGRAWFADHGQAATVQLADGRWRHLLAYRVRISTPTVTDTEHATPVTGAYVEELSTGGPVRPAWRF